MVYALEVERQKHLDTEQGTTSVNVPDSRSRTRGDEEGGRKFYSTSKRGDVMLPHVAGIQFDREHPGRASALE